jgi:hypothetical protein
MDEIQNNGGRFLKRKDVEGRWEEVDYREALKKVCHGIRDCLWNQEAKDKAKRGDAPLPRESEEDTESEAASSTMEEDRKRFLEMAVADEAAARNGGLESSIRSLRQRRLELQGSTPDAAPATAAARLSRPGVVDPYMHIRLAEARSAAARAGIPMHTLLAAQQAAAAAHPHLTAEEAMLLEHSKGRSCIIS